MGCSFIVSSVPPIITGPLENTIINTTEEDTITITCEALGYPPPTIVWSKTNGALNEPVPMSGSVSVPTGNGNVTSVSANFTMTNANREDTGSYKCTASNIVDTNERDVGIIVQCKFRMWILLVTMYCNYHLSYHAVVLYIRDNGRLGLGGHNITLKTSFTIPSWHLGNIG